MHDAGAAAIGRCKRAQAGAGDLLDLAGVMDVFVHDDERAAAPRIGMARQRHRVVQIGRTFRAQRRGRAHGANQHDGLVMTVHQAEEIRGFLERVRPMGNHDACHRGVLAKRVHALRQRAPDVVRHVLAADVGYLLGADLCDAGQLRHRREQVIHGKGARLVAGGRGVSLGPRNRAPRRQHRDDGQCVFRHPPLRKGPGARGANSGAPSRGSR